MNVSLVIAKTKQNGKWKTFLFEYGAHDKLPPNKFAYVKYFNVYFAVKLYSENKQKFLSAKYFGFAKHHFFLFFSFVYAKKLNY
jgi:hypothetical protein